MKFNANNYVEVVLTERGAEIYNAWCNESVYTRVHKQEGEVLKEQLWLIMNIFGKHFKLGSVSPFENCDIHLLGQL